jgi:protein-S-isoprenylcysteine O-methyltransferase Ste14
MLSEPWPPIALFALRQALFLIPLALTVLLVSRARGRPRVLVGALFSLLYSLPLVFVGHALAIHFHCWSYGSETLKMLGFPADIWFGGALLWGPALFFVFPTTSPWLLMLLFVALNGLLLPVLPPLVTPGNGWFLGVVLVFLSAHLPALYLARMTAADTNLPVRAFLLAVAYGCGAFFVLPTVIMEAMGGTWSVLRDRPAWALTLAALGLAMLFTLGASAVQTFALHGDGTPIPLDPTKRLVRTGIYAYLANPMQLSTALAWAIIGAVLGNIWVMLAAGMAVCFVLGMVRWHNRNDLAVRFPQGWPEYQANVPNWCPRWRPWTPATATLQYDRRVRWQRHLVALLDWFPPDGVDIAATTGRLRYREPNEAREFVGIAAMAKAINHTNAVLALLGAALLLIVMPIAWCLHLATPVIKPRKRRRA